MGPILYTCNKFSTLRLTAQIAEQVCAPSELAISINDHGIHNWMLDSNYM